jgi:hypothetical protein
MAGFCSERLQMGQTEEIMMSLKLEGMKIEDFPQYELPTSGQKHDFP